MGPGSKGMENDLSSSYLGELRGLRWALEETKKVTTGKENSGVD